MRLNLTFREERILCRVLRFAQGLLFLGLNSLEATRKMGRTAQENEKKPELQNLEAGPAMALMKSSLLWDRFFVLNGES